MDHGERYRFAVSAVTAAVLGAITAWAVRAGVEAPVLALSVLATAFFVVGAVPRARDAVPRYDRTASIAIGVAALVVYALGHTAEFVVGIIVVGAAAGADLVAGRLRSPSGDDGPSD